MENLDVQDDLQKFEAKDTTNRIPVGWALLFWGLIIWGLYYFWAFSPALGGWSQAMDAESGGTSPGTNMTATVLFTAIPASVVVALWVSRARKKKG